jgi:type IV secretion system protein VirD4
LKAKLILLGILLPIGELISLWLSTIAHLSLTTGFKDKSQLALKNCIEIIATNETARLLFLCLSGVSLLSIIMLLFHNRSSIYESDQIKVTDKIETPISAGQTQHGSARWMNKNEFDNNFESVVLKKSHPIIIQLLTRGNDDLYDKEVKPLKDTSPILTEGGVVLGLSKKLGQEKLFYSNTETHTLCIGATRSGKSRNVVIQSIGLLALAGESLVISDPKSELYNYTAPYLERLGYEVITLDFKNPLKSSRYNFLQSVIDSVNDNDIPKAIDYAWDITKILVGETKGERIWNDGEASVITSSILAVVYDNKDSPQYQNLTNVYKFISEMCKMDTKEFPLNKYLATLSDDHPAKALIGIAEVAPSRTRGSFYTSALTTLRLFTNPNIYDMTCTSDFVPQYSGVTKRALFIILPDDKTTYYPLASLFVAQQYQLLVAESDKRGGELERRVNFLLDEFGNFVQMPIFATMVTVGAGRGMRFNIFVQSFSQIVEKYGKEASETIKSNCHTWIYLRSDDAGTLDEMSKRLGNYTIATHSKSSSFSRNNSRSSSISVNLTGRPLLTSDEIRMIKRPYSLMTSDNHPAILNAPDLSKYMFNKMFGLGNKEHNRRVSMKREENRPSRGKAKDFELWNIWHKFNGSDDKRYREKAKFRPVEMD